MKQQLEQRLQKLKTEFESGQKVLADLQAKETEVQKSLLRISGAIQVLEEELGKANEKDSNGASSEPENLEVVETQSDTVEASNGKGERVPET